MTTAYRRGLVAIAAVSLIAALTGEGRAQGHWPPEEFTAIGIDPGADPPAASVIQIRIISWSSAADEDAITRTLLNGGPAGLLAAVRGGTPVGSIKSPGSLPWTLRFAWQARTADGRRRILILTDRPIGTWEVLIGSPSLDYPFSVIELRLDQAGEGDGMLSVATRIAVDGEAGSILVEAYEAPPMRLANVESRQGS